MFLFLPLFSFFHLFLFSFIFSFFSFNYLGFYFFLCRFSSLVYPLHSLCSVKYVIRISTQRINRNIISWAISVRKFPYKPFPVSFWKRIPQFYTEGLNIISVKIVPEWRCAISLSFSLIFCIFSNFGMRYNVAHFCNWRNVYLYYILTACKTIIHLQNMTTYHNLYWLFKAVIEIPRLFSAYLN
jgi:hypothetical protein